MEKTHRVAYNTVALYANMVVTMLVTLLGTRFVLEALGKQEYALYTLLMSTVLMLSFINVAMANATQRYLSFSMGANDKAQVREIFYNSTVIHSLIALLLGILLLGLGIPAVHYWLDIPYELRDKAVIVLLCMVTSVVCTVLSVPFEATMNAHEDIFVIAGISALEAVCKLAAAVIVLNINHHQLIIYSALMMGASMIAFLCKRMYTHICSG
jgi:Na+-driven multidrug efflux pump